MKCEKFRKGKMYRYTAIAFIVISFLIYGIIPFNLCLPFSYCIITGITVAMVVSSEILFWCGGIMLGKEVVIKLKGKGDIKYIIRWICERMRIKK